MKWRLASLIVREWPRVTLGYGYVYTLAETKSLDMQIGLTEECHLT